ncbi:MAG: GNAT family N-acetyltransferase [Clostridia bacterium]|nr:GNAT family N-acetyltransferase [Clostridia bacterium]
MDFTLRECLMSDAKFILKLKELGMKWYIEKLYGWNVDVQMEKTIAELNENLNNMKIIVAEDKDIGVTTFTEYDNYFQVGLIVIHPDFQNKGIASQIIKNYIEIAKNKQKRIIIKTFKENPAQNLYKRLGFQVYETDNTHLHLEINF